MADSLINTVDMIGGALLFGLVIGFITGLVVARLLGRRR